MSIHCSVVCIRGDHFARTADLFFRLDYRVVGSAVSCSTAEAAQAALDEPTGNVNVVRKVVYEHNGWTYLVDPEMVVMQSDAELSRFSRESSTHTLAWVCEGSSGSYGFKVFAPDLRRDVLVIEGNVETDTGDRLDEEEDIDWATADEREILSLADRLGAPYDGLSVDRRYMVYTLDGSQLEVPSSASLDSTEPPGSERERRPWWRFW